MKHNFKNIVDSVEKLEKRFDAIFSEREKELQLKNYQESIKAFTDMLAMAEQRGRRSEIQNYKKKLAAAVASLERFQKSS